MYNIIINTMNERLYKGHTAETYMQMSSALYIYDIKCIYIRIINI